MRPSRLLGSALPQAILAGLLALVAAALLTATVGASPIEALREIWTGAFGDNFAIGTTLTNTVPLALVALGFTVGYRAGVFNIGLEGQLYAGGLCAALVGAHLDAPRAVSLPLALLAAMAGGAGWALIPALLKLFRGVNEIVTSLLLNYVAIFLVNYLISGPVKDPQAIYPQTPLVKQSARLPELVTGTRITAAIIVVVVVTAIISVVLNRTTLGYEIKTVGGSERVARYAGINVKRTVLVAFLVSGALGGLAGGAEVLGNQFRVVENFSSGWGYTGIAVALLGLATPFGCLLAAFYFGILEAGADQLQFALGVPAAFVLVVEALAVVFVLGTGWAREEIARRLPPRLRAPPPPDPERPPLPVSGADP